MQLDFDREEEHLSTVIQLMEVPAERRAELMEEYRRRSEQAFAPETLRNYLQIKAKFTDWCIQSGFDPNPPVPPQVVARYVDELGGQIKATTIEIRLWAIAEMHKAAFQPNPCGHRLVELALKGVKRKYGAAISQAPPLCKKEVLDVIARLDDSRLGLRDKAVLWVASDSWCRASELVAFRMKHLLRQPDGSSLLLVSRSKTDPYGMGAYAFLSEQGTQAVLRWAKVAGLSPNDPMLTKHQTNARHAPLNPATISRIFKRCTGRPEVSAHSTRVGGVQDAFKIGCDLASIMIAGRWASPEMPARYGRKILASQSAAAQVSKAFSSGHSDDNVTNIQ